MRQSGFPSCRFSLWPAAASAACAVLWLLAAMPCPAGSGVPAQFEMMGAYGPPEPSWAPDGEQIAYTVAAGSDTVICTMRLGAEKSQSLCPGASPSWSPAGDQIALRRGSDLYVVPAAGGPARRLDSMVDTDDSMIAWSHDGRQLAFQKFFRWERTSGARAGSTVFCGEVCVVDVASGNVRQLTRLKEAFPPDAYQQNANICGWLPGDREVVASLPAGAHGPRGLYAIDLEGRCRLLCEGVLAFCSISPDGKQVVGILFEKAGTHLVMSSLPGRPRVLHTFTGPPPWRLVVSWAQSAAIGAGPQDAGKQTTYVLTRYDLGGGTPRVLTSADSYEAAPAISSDGLRVAFYRHSKGRTALFAMRPDGQEVTWIAGCQR